MKSKIYFLFILLIISTNVCYAQKIKDAIADINYIRLPYHRLPETVKTYNISITGAKSEYGNDFFSENYKLLPNLNGYERKSEDSDLLVNIKINHGIEVVELDYDKPRNPRVNESDRLEFYISHIYRVHYQLPALELNISTRNGIPIVARKVGYKKKKYKFGSSSYEDRFTSKELLDAAWAAKKNDILKTLEKELYEQAIAKVATVLTEYALKPANAKVSISYVAEAPKNVDYNYNDFNQAKDLMLQGLKLISQDKIANTNKLIQPKYEEVRTKIKSAIDIWEKMLQESNPEDKKARVDAGITREIYFNLAKAYLWLDNYPKSEEYFQLRQKEGKKVIEINEGLNDFSKFLDDQERRYLQNSWRDVYVNEGEVVESITKTQSREKKAELTSQVNFDKEDEGKIDTSKYSYVHFYMPKSIVSVNKNRYGIYFNNQFVEEIQAGGKISYKIYSIGDLKIQSLKMAKDGEENSTADRKKLNPFKKGNDEVDIDIRPNENYYIKLGNLDGIPKLVNQKDGEEDFKKMNAEVIFKIEDVDDPIPNLSIAMRN